MSLSLALKSSESNVIRGLGTYTYTVNTAGLHSVESRGNMLPGSGLSVVINHNGSPVASSAAPSAAQSVMSIQALGIQCAVNDTLSIVYSSSVNSDNSQVSIATVMLGLNQD